MKRPRRLRKTQALRDLVSETNLSVKKLVMPYFVIEGKGQKKPVSSMPGVYQLSVDNLIKDAKEVVRLGIPAVLLFGILRRKDKKGSQSYHKDGIVQKAVRVLKKEVPELVVITDVCLCSYTIFGHCEVGSNDETLKILARVAVSHAEAGADVVAPSAMMDGQVKAIREALDQHGFSDTAIMSYSAKYASNFYGPFREAARSAPQFGDRKSYQMDYRNSDEALREVEADIEEGADIVMIKPALAYLDVIRRVKDRFHVPIAAYNVSGEYSLVKAAGKKGWIDESKAILEILTAIKRAGADIIITYHAKEIAKNI
ncbi:MAG: porphobilinogen synthase [Candidatus Margulisiibacteriota bacterium]